MNVRQKILPLGRVMGIALGISAAAVTAGEPIRFSKPFIAIAASGNKPSHLPEPRAEDSEFSNLEMDPPRISKPDVALAVPSKESSRLPISRERAMDFSAPEMAPPMVVPLTQQPQPLRRGDPRDEPRDDTPRLLRTPKIFSDPDEEKTGERTSAHASASGRDPMRSPSSNDTSDRQRLDSARALAPMTDFDWDAHHSRSRPKDSPWDVKSATRDRNDPRTRSPFGTQEDSNARLDSTRPNGLSDLFGPRPNKEKLSAARLQRDADFQQLLNPNTGPAGKMPNSLEPVVSAENAGPSDFAAPTLGSTRLPTPAQPMAAFNQPHEQSRGAAYAGHDKKNSPPPAPVPSFSDPRYQAPLNRQPTVHDFPTRKF